MRRPGFARAIIAVVCTLVGATSVLAQTSSDLCTAPQMKTEKWKSRPENGGMNLLLPPGFGASGNGGVGIEDAGAHFYANGEHRLIVVGFGPGIQSIMRNPEVSEKGECETTIAGRRVSMIIYNWVVEDQQLSSSGNAGAHFAAVVRYYPSGSQREVYIALISNIASELKYFKPIFWAVTFDGSPAAASASQSSSAPAGVSNASDMHAAAAAPPAPILSCIIAEEPAGTPAIATVVDSAAVQTQLTGKAEIPNGYELMTVQFTPAGAFSGMKVAQTNFDDATQHELASALGPNVKAHAAAAPASMMLRVDASMRGLHYTTLPAGSCTP
ncbi:MAG: hypothetical protein ABI446_01445 [Gemmatimonadaceae bacterium]